MKRTSKLKILAIILYFLPIFLTIAFTQKLSYFLLSTGIMTILLSLSMNFIPSYIGYKKDTEKYHSSIFVGVSGILLVLLYMM